MAVAERGGSAMWCEGGSMLRDGERCIVSIIGPSTLIVGLADNFEGVQFFLA